MSIKINSKNNKLILWSILRKILLLFEFLQWNSDYLSRVKKFKSFGNNVIFDYGIKINGEQNISIDNDVFIGRNVILNAGRGGNIILKKGCAIGANSTIITWNLNNLYNKKLNRSESGNQYKDVIIGEGAGIGYNVTINPGVSVGKGAEVAAGSVLTRSVKSFSIVAGNPAIVIGKRSEFK